MTGREDQKENDLFFVCSLIDYIGRKTKNYRSTVVNALGREELQHIYDYADVSDNAYIIGSIHVYGDAKVDKDAIVDKTIHGYPILV